MPAAIYWRRRLLALALLLALAWITLQVVGWVRDRDPAGAATPAPSDPAPSATASASTEPESGDLVPVSLPSAQGSCAPENVRIVPSVADGQRSGAPVAIDLLVSTVDGSGCVLTPEEAELLVVISSGGTAVFDSSVCRQSLLTEPVAVPAGWATQTTVEWSGRGSGWSCGDGEGHAGPGEYSVKPGTRGGEPGEVTFGLGEPAPPPEPKPEGQAPAEGQGQTEVPPEPDAPASQEPPAP